MSMLPADAHRRLVPPASAPGTFPSMGSEAVNAAALAFIDALPWTLPYGIRVDVKAAVHAALVRYFAVAGAASEQPSAAPAPAEPLLSRLKSLKVLLGTDSPEVRGWAPVIQQAAQATVNAVIAHLQSAPQPPRMSLTETALAATAEVQKATAKFPTWPTDPLHALAVLGEEFGELTKDVLQMVYEPHKTNRARIRTECVQTAAMALRFMASLDRYEYTPGPQHSQAAGIPGTDGGAS